jgi:hypothetical protein
MRVGFVGGGGTGRALVDATSGCTAGGRASAHEHAYAEPDWARYFKPSRAAAGYNPWVLCTRGG